MEPTTSLQPELRDHSPASMGAMAGTGARVGHLRYLLLPLLLIALAVAFQWQSLQQSRAQYVERARLNAQNLGATLGASIAGSFQNIDLTLRSTSDRVRQVHGNADGAATGDTLRADLEELRERVPSLVSLRATDAAGNIVWGTGQVERINIADRSYFQLLNANPGAGMVISEPIMGRIIKKWVLICARRINLPGGGFGGIVYGSIALEGLAERLSGKEIKLGDQDVFVLRDNQQNIVTRYVHGRQDMHSVGAKLLSPRLAEFDAAGATSGFYEMNSVVDGVARILYFQRIAGQPLSLIVGLSADDALAGWRREARNAWIATAAFALLVAVGAALLYRAQLRREQSALALADAHAFNQEIIDHAALGIQVYSQDGSAVLSNPAMADIVGGSQEQLLGQNFHALAAWRESGAVAVAEQVLADGKTRQMRAQLRTRFGKDIWVHGVFSSFINRGERQLLLMARDITEIQEAREALEESNRKLTVLSVTDGLTGIANRRRFDEMLEKEWRRGARSRQALSLAMIDVDRFKDYNDHYGHQGGDDCLRAVARVLERNCRRAGDLIARYGGEEFVLLSPGTDRVSAQRLAENIRKELEVLALPHALSPLGHVTVSIGLATLVPEEWQEPEVLVRKADQAMYAAKDSGRNRVAAFQE